MFANSLSLSLCLLFFLPSPIEKVKFKLTYSLVQNEPRMPKEGEILPEINKYPILNQEEAHKIFEARFLKDCGKP